MPKNKVDKWKRRYIELKRHDEKIMAEFQGMAADLVRFADHMLQRCERIRDAIDGGKDKKKS